MTETFLKQWAGQTSTAAQGPAKQHEFSVYIPPLLKLLDVAAAKTIVDFQADEGVLSVAFCAASAKRQATFVTISPQDDPGNVMRHMAEDITADMRDRGQIRLAASLADVETASADAIVLSNILGCQGSVENVEAVLKESSRVLKPAGFALVTIPNPNGGAFSSYTCRNIPEDRALGGVYDFQMRGEEEWFKNLYLPTNELSALFSRYGMKSLWEDQVADKSWQDRASTQPAFYQQTFRKIL